MSMPEQSEQRRRTIGPGRAADLSGQFVTTPDDLEDNDVERVEVLSSGAEDRDDIEEDGLGEKLNELAATTEEEVDSLRMNLLQDDEPLSTRDSSARVVDDTAEEQIARFTEADPVQGDIGAVSVEPGRDDTSRMLRRHHPNTTIARSYAFVEGNLDEPMDEAVAERKVDEGTSG